MNDKQIPDAEQQKRELLRIILLTAGVMMIGVMPFMFFAISRMTPSPDDVASVLARNSSFRTLVIDIQQQDAQTIQSELNNVQTQLRTAKTDRNLLNDDLNNRIEDISARVETLGSSTDILASNVTGLADISWRAAEAIQSFNGLAAAINTVVEIAKDSPSTVRGELGILLGKSLSSVDTVEARLSEPLKRKAQEVGLLKRLDELRARVNGLINLITNLPNSGDHDHEARLEKTQTVGEVTQAFAMNTGFEFYILLIGSSGDNEKVGGGQP